MGEPHPQVQAVLAQLAEADTPPTFAVRPETAREQFSALLATDDPEPVGSVQETHIDGPGGSLPLRIYHPDGNGPFPMVVYFHGGGWVIGDLDTHDNVCRRLTNLTDALVISVDYRLAPEHPFPAAVEDAYAATEWAATYGDRVGGDPDRIALAGDSAGGNLAAAVSLRARDMDGPTVDHQALFYPAVNAPDLEAFESYHENAEGYLLEYATMEWFYDQYVADPYDLRNAYLAPLQARDLSDLPPATIVTAEFDPLRDEGRAYAKRLSAAGVDVEHEEFEGMIHAFVNLFEVIDRANDAIDLVTDRLTDSFDG